ncbi:adhesion G protein-coupled receptor E2-like isoform X3, partial [Silurus asotus]
LFPAGLLLAVLNNVTTDTACGGGFIPMENGACEDINECSENKTICGPNALCTNTVGSYFCVCAEGFVASNKQKRFTGSQNVTCNDTNECTKNKIICGPNALCNNTVGSYFCMCIEGFVASNKQKRFTGSQNVTCNENKTICGPNALCTNTVGSYFCVCNEGFVASNKQKRFNGSQNVTCNDIDECTSARRICGNNADCHNTHGSYYCTCVSGGDAFTNQDGSHTCTVFEHIGGKSLRMEQSEETREPSGNSHEHEEMNRPVSLLSFLSKSLERTVFNQLSVYLSQNNLHDPNQSGFKTAHSTETALLAVSEKLHAARYNKYTNISSAEVELLIHRSPNAPHGGLSMSTDSVQLNSHWETAAGNSYKGYAAASMITYESLDNNNSAINSYSRRKIISTDQFRLNSKVVTITVTNRDTAHLKKSVKLRFSHLQETSMKSVCVFWDSTLKGGAWSSEGCTVHQSNTKSTVCLCSHLSSFAVLMALYEMEDVFELELITWIGLSLSLICFLICILTFWLIRSIQSTRTTIHLHLCISFFIADFIFLVGINQTTNKVGCGVVAGLLHFFFLSVFCWMCLEGVQLFRMVVLVFNTTLSRGYMMAAGYGIPALIVIISASVNYRGYGTPRYCWLSLENDFMWSFFGPVCTIIVVNAIFFIITVTKLAQKFNSLNPDLSNLRKIKTFTITAIAQLCVLGIMWIFGCFQFNEEMLVMSYLFTILNSFQGVLMFIMHCLFSKQVRDEYIRFLTCLTMQKSSYSEFSTNQSSKSQVYTPSQST